jgi:hypothetical protein
MSVVLLHGVVPQGTARPAEAPRHARWAAGGLLALTSRAPEALLEDVDGGATVEAGLVHDRLLSAYAQVGPVMPIRFGALFSGPDAVRARVSTDAVPLVRGLARLGMAREYGVRLVHAAPREGPRLEEPPTERGREFLHLRAAERRQRRAQAESLGAFLADVEARLSRHAAEIRQTGRTGRDRLADLAALVPPERERDFLHLSEALGQEAARHGIVLRLGGPWPAYSFCAEAGHG